MGNRIAVTFELLDLESVLAAIDPVPGPGVYFLLQALIRKNQEHFRHQIIFREW